VRVLSGALSLILIGHAPVRAAVTVVEVGDQVVELEASQEHGDRVLRVEAASGVVEMNWRRPPKPETLLLVEPGRYRIDVRLAPGQAPAAEAPLVVRRRARVEADAARAQVDVALAETTRLLATGGLPDAQAARARLEQALAALSEPAESGRAAEVRVRLAEVLLSAGEVDDAEAQLREALAAFAATGDRAGEIDARRTLGLIHNWRGQPSEAEAEYLKAVDVALAIGDRRGEAMVRGNLGSTYVYLGENQKALESFRAALAAAHACGAGREEAWATSNLARAWHALGEFDRALESARQALPLMDRVQDAKGRLGVLLNTGVILSSLHRYDDAVRALEQGLALAVTAGDQQTQAPLLGRLGEARAGSGDSAGAVAAFREALALYEKQHARRAEGLVLAALGAVQRRMGDPSARESLERALARGRTAGDPTIEAAALKELAAVALAAGDLPRARELSGQALAVVESVRLQVLAPEFRSSYFASVQDYYELSIAVLLASHREPPEAGFAAEAFHISERARARSLLEAVAGGRADIHAGIAPDLQAREAESRRVLELSSRRLLRLMAGGTREGEVAAAEKQVADLVSADQELQAEIKAKSPRYAALAYPTPLTLREVQEQLLDDDTTLVELALGEAGSHGFVIDRAGLRVVDLAPRAVLEQAARDAHRALSERPLAASGHAAADTLHRLSAALVEPLPPLATRRLVFVAQGALQYVPFAALHTADGRTLVETHEVTTLPSASVLAVLRRETAGRRPAPGRVAIFADPVFEREDPRLPASARETRLDRLGRLPFTRREAAAIARIAGPAGVRTALGFEASRDLAVSPELARYQVLHFATHGRLDDEHPELSGLVLSLFDAEGRPRDGFLRLADIYNLDLPADLVVLSACRTALGKSVRGEGLVGLARAFMYAGAARVLASLWRVDDAATAELMAEFYRILFKEGCTPAEALRGAQRHMQSSPRWRHPYYWAAFTLQGEWR
jgi:CHAT domain-containing protein/Tfp pilus assembly protein PilF